MAWNRKLVFPSRLLISILTGRSPVVKALALGARNRRFKSSRPDKLPCDISRDKKTAGRGQIKKLEYDEKNQAFSGLFFISKRMDDKCVSIQCNNQSPSGSNPLICRRNRTASGRVCSKPDHQFFLGQGSDQGRRRTSHRPL